MQYILVDCALHSMLFGLANLCWEKFRVAVSIENLDVVVILSGSVYADENDARIGSIVDSGNGRGWGGMDGRELGESFSKFLYEI